MKKLKSRQIFTGIMMVFILTFILPSCATTRANRISTQKRGLMLQDKSEFSMNKKFKGSKSKSFKKQKRKSKKMKKRIKRR